jgi:glycosyltransferase involved in cell wall biosynthesis
LANILNVLNIYKTYFPDPPGGLQEAIRQICLSTSRNGVENTIFSLTPNLDQKIIMFPEAEVVREKSWWAPASCDISGPASLRTYAELANRSDVIHFFYPWPYADLLNLLAPSKKPKVLTYISDVVQQKFLNKLYAPLMWRTLHQMDVIVANCEAYVRTSPILSHPSIRDKVRIIPLGIDELSLPATNDLTPNASSKLATLSSGEPYFLFIGVHRYYKGIHTLIKASKFCNAKVLIAGSGPKTTELKNLASQIGATNVIFLGQVSDIEKLSLIAGSRALILPSHLRSEAYGMVLVEASIFGKPMISCEIGTGTSFINLDGKTGLVIPPESELKLAKAMNLLLSNPTLAAQMGGLARERYEENFSGKVLGDSYTKLYKELV